MCLCERGAERDRRGERKWSSHAIRARVWQQHVVSAQIWPSAPTPSRQSPAPCCSSIICHHTSQSSSWATYRSWGFMQHRMSTSPASHWTSGTLDYSTCTEKNPRLYSAVVLWVGTFGSSTGCERCCPMDCIGFSLWSFMWRLGIKGEKEEKRKRSKGEVWVQGRVEDRKKSAGWWEMSTNLLKRTVKDRR